MAMVCCGAFHALAVTAKGNVFGWGQSKVCTFVRLLAYGSRHAERVCVWHYSLNRKGS